MEIWKPAIECFDHVEVSNFANVRTRDKERFFTKDGKVLSQVRKGGKLTSWLNRAGYPTISVKFNGKRPKFFVHRLVARAFVDGWKEGLCVNHINGIKTDNRPENLEWVTLARNTELQWETGLVDLRGEKHPSAKLTEAQAREIYRRVAFVGNSVTRLAREFNVSTSLVYLIKDKKRWAGIHTR